MQALNHAGGISAPEYWQGIKKRSKSGVERRRRDVRHIAEAGER